jgi:hypothetical protein
MDIDTSLLPPVAKLLVRRLGLDHALAVIRAYGGLPLYVPLRPNPALIDAIGKEAAEALCYHFAGEEIWHVPKCLPALLAARNRAIVQAARDGTPQTSLARKHNLCWRQIHNIVQGRRNGRDGTATDAPSPQPDLFTEPAP